MAKNLVVLDGNLCCEPEARQVGDRSVVTIRVATNERIGKDKEVTTYTDCEAWGQLADVISKHARKGSRVEIVGKLRLDEWQDKTTQQKRSKHKVLIDHFEFGYNPKAAEEHAAAAAAAETADTTTTTTTTTAKGGKRPRKTDAPPPAGDGSEEIPF